MKPRTVIRVLRAPFFTAVIVPVLLGATIAWREGAFHVGYFLLTLIGAICVNAGMNLSNDYFDHLSGNDERNRELTPFSGGSRVIQEGIVSPGRVLAYSVVFYVLSVGVGLYLVFTRGWVVLALGLAGVFLALFHNAPPVRIYHLWPGAGELAAGLGCGPLTVMGAYYVQTQRLSYEVFWASIPVALLITAVLYINEFPDYRADKAVGKKTLVVVLGRERAVWGYIALMVATYAVILVGVVLGVLPYPVLIALITLPLAYRGIRGALRFHSDTPKLIPTNAVTIQLHLMNGLLLVLGYGAAKFL
jgi:1,4-dihydroxy-2-naphthoate octaprenyltransferase